MYVSVSDTYHMFEFLFASVPKEATTVQSGTFDRVVELVVFSDHGSLAAQNNIRDGFILITSKPQYYPLFGSIRKGKLCNEKKVLPMGD